MDAISRTRSWLTRETSLRLLFALLLGLYAWFWFQYPTYLSDAVADWAQVKAVQDGLNPYTDVALLAGEYGARLEHAGLGELGAGEWVHPRTPGALLLLSPIGFLDSQAAYRLYVGASAIILWFVLFRLVPRVAHARPASLVIFGTVLLISAPVVSAFEYGTVSIVIAALTLLVWILWDSDRQWLVGLILGVAVVLKLWPALLLVPLLVHRRHKAVLWCVGVTVGMNAGGVLLFHLSIADSIAAISSASQRWIHFSANGSLPGMLVGMGIAEAYASVTALMISAVVVGLFAARYGRPAYPLAIALGVLASPLSWEHYDVALLPIVAVTLGASVASGLLTGAFILLATSGLTARALITDDLNPTGIRTFIGRLALVAAIGLWIRSDVDLPHRGVLRRASPRHEVTVSSGASRA